MDFSSGGGEKRPDMTGQSPGTGPIVAGTSYPRSWYPFCRSIDVRPGRRRAVTALGLDWLVFRADDGSPGVLPLHCPHGGANLELGTVCGDAVVCPMHGWRLNRDGKTGRKDAEGRDIASDGLPAVEYAGILYAFWGGPPVFPFPKRWPEDRLFSSRVRRYQFEAPHELGGINAFDVQHLGPVHRRRLVSAPEVDVQSDAHIAIRYRAAVEGNTWRDRWIRRSGLHTLDIEVHSHGGSLLIFEHRRAAVSAYIALQPRGDGTTRVFLSITREKDPRRLRGWLQRPFHWIENAFFRAFAAEDLKVLHRARLITDRWDPALDGPLIRWWSHYCALPRRETAA